MVETVPPSCHGGGKGPKSTFPHAVVIFMGRFIFIHLDLELLLEEARHQGFWVFTKHRLRW